MTKNNYNIFLKCYRLLLYLTFYFICAVVNQSPSIHLDVTPALASDFTVRSLLGSTYRPHGIQLHRHNHGDLSTYLSEWRSQVRRHHGMDFQFLIKKKRLTYWWCDLPLRWIFKWYNIILQNGLASSLPPLARFLASLGGGHISDLLISRETFSITVVRKIFMTTGKIVKFKKL